MTRPVPILGATLLLTLLISCVTINIYFPAEELKGAADKIVNEVYGDRSAGDNEQKAPPAKPAPGSGGLRIELLPAAWAAQDINVTTPEIRAIKTSMKDRSPALFHYLDGGQVGIGSDGMLLIRDPKGLSLKQRGEMKHLVKQENSDRKRLYREIAAANGFADRSGEVQQIFAESWRGKASHGWYLQNDKGGWDRK